MSTHHRHVFLSPLVVILASCGGSDLGKVLHDYGYSELRPPSTLTPPGTIIGVRNGETPIIVCTRDEALGPSVTTLSSDSKSSDLAQKTEGSFELDANYLGQIKVDAKYESVENVKLTLRNTKVLAISVAQAIDKARERSAGCVEAIERMNKRGISVSMVYSVLQADVAYTVEFRSSANVASKQDILTGLATQLGAKYDRSVTSSLAGTSLFWGLVDNADMVQGTTPQPGTTVVKIIKDPARGGDVKVISLLPERTGFVAQPLPP